MTCITHTEYFRRFIPAVEQHEPARTDCTRIDKIERPASSFDYDGDVERQSDNAAKEFCRLPNAEQIAPVTLKPAQSVALG